MFRFFQTKSGRYETIAGKKLFKKEIFRQINPNLKKFHLSENKNYNGLFEYDMKYSLSSHHVFRDDLSAMKYGIEFRYPYLSNDLIDFVSSLPEKLRYNGVQNKPLLRRVAQNHLPSDVLSMPKRGFSFSSRPFIRSEKRSKILLLRIWRVLKKENSLIRKS